MKRKTTEQFIEEAIKVHGNKYDYSLVEYINALTKVKIICKIHKTVFEQLPVNHLSDHGCITCGGREKLTTEKFIERSIVIHGNKYDYSLVEYKANNIKIKIICKKHNEIFEQTPVAHMCGQNCPICGGVKKLTTEEFIKRAIIIHGDKYDYSEVNYINYDTKVKIFCKKHKDIFFMTPDNHLHGQICPKCAGKFMDNEYFIKKASEVHDNKYDYSLVKYISAKQKIKIICPAHGIFEQEPSSHLSHCGCPICSESKGENTIAKYLDNLNIKYEREKSFEDCRNINKLPFDFYLNDFNVFIEFDGRQHFIIIDFFGGENTLKKLQTNDQIKNEYAKATGRRILRIKYNEINNIKEIIDKTLTEWQQVQVAI